MTQNVHSPLHKRDGQPAIATILFADLVGSTRTIDGLLAEDARDLLDQALEVMRRRIRQFGGVLARVQGDGIMAVFGAVEPVGDHALRACCAAHSIATDFANETGHPAVRVGVHTGRILLRVRANDFGTDLDAIGPDVHLAAKIEHLAAPNSAVVSGEVVRLAGPSVQTSPARARLAERPELGLHRLDSIALDQNVRHLFPPSTTAPMIGRDAILGSFDERLRDVTDGKGWSLGVVSEAGLGKSRLALEVSRIATAREIVTEELRCSPAQTISAFAPLTGLVRRLTGSDLAATLALLDIPATSVLPLLDLLGAPPDLQEWSALDPGERRARIVGAVRALVRGYAKRQPILLLVEDAHWLDDDTAQLLALLRDDAASLPMALLVTSRPDGRAACERIVQSVLDLGPLAKSDMHALLSALAGSGEHAISSDTLIEQADGSPLFLQELVRRPATDHGVPLSLLSLLQGRLSRLPPSALTLARALAVVGRTRTDTARAAANQSDEDFSNAILTLQREDLLRAATDGKLELRHDLIAEAILATLPRDEARALHERAWRALASETDTPDTAEKLAMHCAQCGRVDEAMGYLLAACRNAVRTFSIQTIRRIHERARNLPSPSDTGRRLLLDITALSLDALQQSGDIELYRATLTFCIAQSQRFAERIKEAQARCHLSVSDWMLGRHEASLDNAKAALAIGNDLASTAISTTALAAMANAQHGLGDARGAIRSHLEVIRRVEAEGSQALMGRMMLPGIRSRAFAAWFLADCGDFGPAAALLDEASSILGQFDQAYSRLLALASRANLEMRREAIGAAIPLLQEGLRFSVTNRLLGLEPTFSGWLGSALARAGRATEGFQITQESLEAGAYRNGGKYTWIQLHIGCAEAAFGAGFSEHALNSAETAVRLSEECGQPIHLAESCYTRGLVRAALGLKGADDDAAQSVQLAEHHEQWPLAVAAHDLAARRAVESGLTDQERRHSEQAAAIRQRIGLGARSFGVSAQAG